LCALAALLAVQALTAQAQSPGALQQRLAGHQARERALRAGVASDDRLLAGIRGSVAQVQARLSAAQARLAAAQARLNALQGELRAARAHLVQLQQRLRDADAALRANLVSQYESNEPDLIAVVMSARGFADLLEQGTYYSRIQQQDARIIATDRRVRTQVIAQATRLGRLEAQAQADTQQILAQRDSIDTLQLALLRRQGQVQAARNRKSAQLASESAVAARLQADLARVQARERALVAPAAPGRVLRGGGFTFPMPAGAAVGPGSWTLDQGVDIAAPGHTPLLAVGSGTIVLHGIGGFGAWAPVLHLDGGQYVYYGHAGPGGQLPVGTHVAAGQVIGEVGAGIVGISSGPHLEIGFCDASGTPNGGASTMMALLRGAYGG
jgi:murein DD-endopeptidase MepM/ murein hydrolase activator NlpD